MVEGALEAMAEAKQAGKIRATGISDHQDGEFLAYVIERYHDMLDMVMYPLSFIRPGATENLLPLTKKHGLGYVAMKPIARREVFGDPDFIRYAESISQPPAVAAFRWVLDHPEVSVALAAVNDMREIEENAGASV